MDDAETGRFFGIFFENNEAGVVAIGRKGSNFFDGEFVAVAVIRSRHENAVWEDCGQEIRLFEQSTVERRCDENFGNRRTDGGV